jgi:hypothetical protein
MALTVGTNSWVTILEADAYLTDRIGASSWFDLPDSPANPGEDSKETMLVSAFYWLTGSPELEIPPNSADGVVKNAQIESALFLLEHYGTINEHRGFAYAGVESFSFSKRSESINLNKIKIPEHIIGLLPEYATGEHAFINLTSEYQG